MGLFDRAAPAEILSLKGGNKAFLAASKTGAVPGEGVYRRRRPCCGLCPVAFTDQLGTWSEFIASFRTFFIGEPGDRPWFNVLLVICPIAVVAKQLEWNATAQFVLALLAMVPLAERLGFTTECLADVSVCCVGAHGWGGGGLGA